MILGLLGGSITLLRVSPSYRLEQLHSPMLYHQGYAMLISALLLAAFYRSVAAKLLWVTQEIHRLASAFMLFAAVAVDGGMHLLNIPHMEGWWLPLFSGSALISGLGAWLRQWRRKSGNE